MKIRVYFLFIIISLSCSNHEGKEGIVVESAEAIVIKPDFSKNIVDIYPNLDTIKYVKLELSDSSIITEITKIEVYDSLLYVLDAKASSLFVFDMNGKYHFKIHSIGQGPQEYTQLDFFSIDRDLKQIVLTDLMGYFVMRYDLKGNYISRQKIPFWAEGVIPIQNKGVVLYANYRDNSKYLKKEYNIIYLDSLNQIQYTYFQYNSSLIGRTKFITPSGGISYTYNDQSYFFNPFNDTVYQLAPAGLVVKYIFNLGERRFDQTHFSKNKDELSSYVNKGEYYNIMGVLETDDWVGFSLACFSKVESWHGFYSKKSGEIINAEFYYNRNQNFIPDNLATFNSWFIAELPIDYLLHSKDQNKTEPPEGMAKKELKSLLQTLTEDDNPVLMMYKLKDS